MEVIEPPLPCGLPGAISCDGLPEPPPTTRVVMVDGIGGPVSADRPQWMEHWLPPGDANDVVFSPSPSAIVDLGKGGDSASGLESEARRLLDDLIAQDHSGFWAFWTDDIGGSVVKLALIIAAEEAQYRRILNITQAVIFFGTPHKSSAAHSIDSALFSLIEARFGNLLGDWLPKTVNILSRKLENIHDGFIRLCHRFKVVSYYQRTPTSALTYRVLVPQECAILDLDGEVTLGVDRAHDGMKQFMTRHEEHIARTHLMNAKIALWDPFRYAMAMLEPVQFGHEINLTEGLCGGFPPSQPVECDLDKQTRQTLLDWVLSKGVATTHLVIRPPSSADPTRLANAAAQAIWDCPEALWSARPGIEAPDVDGNPPDRVWLLTSLIRQLLTQQPHAFLHMGHLLDNLADAMRHNLQAWKARTLWLCLRALIHAPVAAPMYGFLPLETPQGRELLKEIDSELQGTDSQLRLVLLAAGSSHVLDLDNSRFATLDAQVDNGHEEQSPAAEIPDKVPSKSRNALLSIPKLAEQVSLSMLRLCLADLSSSVFTSLAWVAFAVRPLSTDELDHAVALTGMPDGLALAGTSTDGFPRGAAVRLLDQLPQIAKVDREKVVLRIPYDRTRETLRSHWPNSHDLEDTWSPHLYLGDRCLGLIKGVFGVPSPDESVKWTVGDVQKIQGGVTEYAARAWVVHCSLAVRSGSPIDSRSTLSEFAADESAIHNWLLFVEYLSRPPPPASESPTYTPLDISDPRLMECLSVLGRFEQLKTLYELASRPSSLPALGRLLVYAADNGRCDIIDLLPAEAFQGAGGDAVSRALASSDRTVYQAVRRKAVSCDVFDTPVMTQAQLAAQMLGNTAVATGLRRELLRLGRGEERDIWLSGALRRALEYGDEDTVKELLHHQGSASGSTELGEPGDPASEWITLHTAAYYGTLDSILRVEPTRDMGVTSPDGLSPLFIAASRGLARLVPLVISHGASVDAANTGKDGWTALHAASRFGRCHTLGALLQEKADVTIPDQNGDFPLHLAIRWGHARAAELMAENFPSVADWDWSHGYGQGDEGRQLHAPVELDTGDGDPLPVAHEASVSAPLNRANSEGWTVLIEAAHRDLPTVCRLLLERGADPSLVEDWGKLALHGAARIGSARIAKDLVDKGSVVNQAMNSLFDTPLHFACYRGYAELTEQLLPLADLTLEDYWSRTPLSAAASAGHTSVVKMLLPRYKPNARAKALCSAVQYGHREVVAYLLDAGCPVNGVDAGSVPLAHAQLNDHSRMVQLLVQRGADLNREDSSGERALVRASKLSSSEAVKILVDGGADPDAESNGDTPLCSAIYWERLDTVRLLVERGARLRLSSQWSHYVSLLDFAMGLSTKEVVGLLVEHYVHGKHEDGLTPGKALLAAAKRDEGEIVDLILQTWVPSAEPGVSVASEAVRYAASAGNIALLDRLIRHPAGKSAVNSEIPDRPKAGTPLHAAILSGMESAVQVLLDAGADPGKVSGAHGTALNAACFTGNAELVSKVLGLLAPEQIGVVAGTYGTPIQSAVMGFKNCAAEDMIKVLELLWTRGASPSTVGGLFNTPLHLAVKLPVPVEVVAWLMNQSAYSLNVLDAAGRSPFHLAVVGGDWGVLQAVVDKMESIGLPDIGVTLQSRDNQGLTPLHYAAVSKTADMMERLLQLLEEQGLLAAALDSSDVDGWTPLHWACRQSISTIVELLIAKKANTLAKTRLGWTPRHIAILHGNGDATYLANANLPDTGEVGEGLPDGAAVTVGGYCDVCYVTISWRYWHCSSPDCNDFDLCYKCYNHADQVHPSSHVFEPGPYSQG
ncbi:ankyrin repeat-containing domain protein [Echria macrotheca]|uniref:Ankyrin repeat-containing domain protein n=1 Tax=Echria macrotheca TaxID=438768 RepID=A0AAJ0FC94_9PEZI|nr:ankyrin repeat-containing domain protein [Echria macrotheca]